MNRSFQITPPGAALAMPTQVLNERPPRRVAAPSAASQSSETRLARLITFGGSLVLTAIAGYQMATMLPLTFDDAYLGGWNAPVSLALTWLLLALFTITFGWVALTAMAAVAGAVCAKDFLKADPQAPLVGQSVLLMPVYNEDPVSVCARLAAMAEDLDRIGLARHFEIFVVSDSDDPALWPQEAATVQDLQRQLTDIMPVWYRRRGRNTARKAGNIREFINRWGERYDYMVVLDADSLIAGDTLATLVREMDADADLGILQTLPRLVGGETLYARMQAFANAIYGPVFARGLSAWQGEDGNYWGHNAIIRVRAFAESAGLPSMAGPRPFGGEIRSHDFVEAALMLRAGWTVRMLTELKGSWEESPPTLLDAAVRDRRWAQGNVQHLAVLPTKGLRWPSRVHMLMGVMNYVSSPLWLATVLAGLALYAWTEWHPASVGSPLFESPRMILLFSATMGLVLMPKLLGLARALGTGRRPRETGRWRLLAIAVSEQLFSILCAPIVMMLHSRFLWEIFRGQDSGWSAQQRRGRAFPLRVLLQRHGSQTLAGLGMTALLAWVSSPLLLWMLPMTLGLALSIPLSAISASRWLGHSAPREDRNDWPAVLGEALSVASTQAGAGGVAILPEPGMVQADRSARFQDAPVGSQRSAA